MNYKRARNCPIRSLSLLISLLLALLTCLSCLIVLLLLRLSLRPLIVKRVITAEEVATRAEVVRLVMLTWLCHALIVEQVPYERVPAECALLAIRAGVRDGVICFEHLAGFHFGWFDVVEES